MASTIEISDARRSAADCEWIRNVYPLYLHDLSEFDDGYYRLNERGLWEPDHLSDWLSLGPHQHALLIRAGGARAGFAFVGQAPFEHMAPGLDFRLCELFVLRALRGRGVGRAAAFAVFDRFRGSWEVEEMRRNEPAVRFWGRDRRVHGRCRAFREEPSTDGFPRQVFRMCYI